MKKRVLSLFLGMVMAAALFAGCGSEKTEETAESTTDTEKTPAADSDDPYAAATELTDGVLRVGMECAYAPFNWTQSSADVDAEGWEGVPIYGTSDYAFGYDVMVAKQLADELGWDLEIHKVEWSSIILGMQSGDYDVIIAGMAATDERRQTIDFTNPYYIRDNVMVVKKGGDYEDATTLSDFDGATITTQINTSWVGYLDQVPNGKIGVFPETTAEVIMQVAMGTVDCALLDYPTAYSATLSNPDVAIVVLDETDDFITPEGMSEDLCIGIEQDNTVLRDALNAAMENIGWDDAKMSEYMDLAIEVQPLG